ncbi:MAG TPA: EAL domain-containing protein [Acidimicrobiales bacterium]|jgi:diguanylate cyclase (GGDEF)-like protein
MTHDADAGAGRVALSQRLVNLRVWTLSSLLLAAGAALQVAGLSLDAPTREHPMDRAVIGVLAAALAVLFAVTEAFVVRVQLRRDSHAFTLSEIPLILGLAFFSPAVLIAARLVGGAGTLLLVRRQSPIKLAFNLSMFYVETSLAVVVYRAILSGSEIVSFRSWVGAFAVAVLTNAVTAGLVSVVIRLNGGRPGRTVLWHGFLALGAGVVTNTCMALIAVTTLDVSPASGVLLATLGGIFYVVYRAYAALGQRYASLESLHAFSSRMGRSLQVDEILQTILIEAQELLRAERAELLLVTDDGQTVARVTVDDRDDVQVDALDDTPAELAEVVDTALRVAPGLGGSPTLRRQLADRGVRHALLAPLRGKEGLAGVMMVANRMEQPEVFDPEDLKLFETLANHASVSLENGRLVERLRRVAAENEHQALHDHLTGLPNRELFGVRTGEAIAEARRTGRSVAVMLLDLDRFKEINDTLGHHFGDTLLEQVSTRLLGLLSPADTIARLGGDEFAILLTTIDDVSSVRTTAERVLESLTTPFHHQELALEVGVSIGIALYPDHGAESQLLLQRADVAMYAAKQAQCGYDIYAPERDQYSPRRLALVGELRSAVDNEELDVYYQPVADLRLGVVTAVEALVRWNHPRHGFLPPDEFVMVAERTGLIRSLSLFVIRRSLAQCKRWEEDGLKLALSVNLSARSLLDGHLPDDVATLVEESGVEPSRLTLEITESSFMSDSTRTHGVLTRLSDMGVQLAIDDFGTGYSSLSYLRRLPVDEIKIDRSFVTNMLVSENDSVIVHSIIDLARNLGLTVTAEGVEHREAWDQLAGLGCHRAQGYYLSRPQPVARLGQWLSQTGGRVPGALSAVPDPVAALRNAPVTRIDRATGQS